ncbi:peptide-methionine (S)-S-oxide reductase MsrA [Akkermansiaceae bacterium]|nr:peptide-methionine (S)-S-oxide reductase MsrA [Akkermansiaceae bacterium]
MLTWTDILTFAANGNPEPDREVRKSEDEWREQLTEEQFYVARQHGTERPFSSGMCELFEPGKYACVCCDTLLFDAGEKFDSGTGWPSFTQPAKDNAISYHGDNTMGMTRVETLCNTCDAHLGHVFPDGPAPSGLRYCMNAVALKKADDTEAIATFGGGCYWCAEAVFRSVKGVISVESGFSDGEVVDPTYKEVCSGQTGHAEVVQITYDPEVVSYGELLRVHMGTHDPTTLNAQGADVGTQYRSTILYRSEQERQVAEKLLEELSDTFESDIVTDVKAFEKFYPAPADHDNYYNRNPTQGYCHAVISPKIAKFRKTFQHLLNPDE